jgi:sporulation protein YlmC with PRC-barrel domain
MKADGRKLKRLRGCFVAVSDASRVAQNLPRHLSEDSSMVRSFKALNGFTIRATDGHFGAVSDLYFDDRNWRIRYCVVDTGRWFASRYVLIGSRALSVLDGARRELWVRLSKAQVGGSPNAGTDRPVSKQDAGGVRASVQRLRNRQSADRLGSTAAAPDRHLRSCQAVVGHRLLANDGRIGHVEDFLIDDKGWAVQQLVVVPSSRSLPGKARVLIAPDRVSAISWHDATVSVDVPRAGVAINA